jgi:PAS domain S-box-containing protein
VTAGPAWGKLYHMSPTNDFYALLSSLLQQTAQDPYAPPAIPLNRWPVESEERRLLEILQAALTALQSSDPNALPAAEDKEPRYQSIFENTSDGLIIHELETGRILEANPAACSLYGYEHDEFIDQLPASFMRPDSSHQFAKYVQAVQSEGVSVAQQVHLRQDGSPFHAELNGSILVDQGCAYLLSVVRDISQRVQAEQLLQQRVEERNREQSTLLEISQTLASALELQPDLILDQMRVIIDYTLAGLFKLEDSTLVTMVVRGPQALEQAMPFQIRLKSPEALAELFNERKPTRIANVQSADPPAQFLRSLLADQASILLEGVQSWMWVPLAIKSRLIGVIGVARAERNYFTAHHADLALTVANQAAITMANAELYENAQMLATLQERQRLARNLHDAVNQSLFSAGLIAEVLPRLWERDPDEGRQSLEDLRRLTRGAQADMRLLLAELRPSTLTDAELGDLLRLLGNALAGRTNIPFEVTITGEGKLPSQVQVALYRLCQEGLNNIAKHAGASRVNIWLQYEPGAVELRIRDDGRGFDPEQTPPGHYGLSMMNERATAVGAMLSIHSQPGYGTEIVIRWPETPEQEAGER